VEKRFLIIVTLLSILVFGYGTVQAATSSIDNLPGGAGVFYWQAGRNGDYTLVNVQNIADIPDTWGAATSTAIVIHLTLYDRDSNHIFDWSCPLSQRDNYGFAIQNDGTCANQDCIKITNDGTPFYMGPVGGIGNCTLDYTGIPVTHNPGTGAGALQYGYGTVTITRTDAVAPQNLWRTPYKPDAAVRPPAGNGNGDARDEADMAGRTVVLPDLIFVRTALLGTGYAYALNGNMLQGFMNMSKLQAEDVASADATTVAGAGWVAVQGADALCALNTVDWNNDGLFNTGAVALPDFNGIDIHAPELYITNNRVANARGIALDLAGAANCSRAGRRVALGSADGIYWARYNVTPGLTETTLITVAPASNAHALNPARGIADSRAMTVSSYNDAEIPVSVTPLVPPEVGLSPFLSAANPPRPGNVSIGHGGMTAGEARININAPLYGYVFTTVSGVEADLYPLVKNRVAVNVLDLGTAGVLTDGAGVNNIEYIGF